MTIEPVTELGSGGALRPPRARVIPLSAPSSSYTAAVERYLTGAGIAKSSARIYRISLTTWGWMRGLRNIHVTSCAKPTSALAGS
ncbi:hypothetical protein ABR737_07095 [Streptomyces sp. Edi2]|uniref:hypothetical protein n=1 Tax=Streptomyces sp. Edi2 TaxID=3162528 RepID=UPI0033061B47